MSVATESSSVSDTIVSLFPHAVTTWRDHGAALGGRGRRLAAAGCAGAGTAPVRPGNRLAEHPEHQLGEPVVQARDDDHHEEHEDQAHHRVGDKLLAGRPDDLVELGDYLPEEQGGGGPFRALGRTSGSAPFLGGIAACLSRHILTYRFAGSTVWPDRTRRAGGTRTPNHRFWRPGLWPIELLPSAVATLLVATPFVATLPSSTTLLHGPHSTHTGMLPQTTARLPVHAVYVQ